LQSVARGYLADAEALLDPAPPRLVAVGGLSGSGKTTVARALAPPVGGAPRAGVLRSDVVRKRLAGVAASERLPPEAYAPETSVAVYAALAERAASVLAAGLAVVVDAVFAEPSERKRIARLAGRAGVPFTGLWLGVKNARRTTSAPSGSSSSSVVGSSSPSAV
jgi:predicted kinase